MNITISVTPLDTYEDLDRVAKVIDLLQTMAHMEKQTRGDRAAQTSSPKAAEAEAPVEEKPAKRKPGRPRKTDADKPKRKPGRPRKNPEPELWEEAEGEDDEGDDPLGEKDPKGAESAEPLTRTQIFDIARAFVAAHGAGALRKVNTAMGLNVLADVKPKQHAEMASRMYEACKDDDEVESLRLAAGV